jgi:hypothetical protein
MILPTPPEREEEVIVRTAATGVALLATFPTAGGADALPRAKRYENVRWYRVVRYAFKPGMVESAMKLWTERFLPASVAAGIEIELSRQAADCGGEWDLVSTVTMSTGPGELEYEVTPQDERYVAALVRQEGGLAQARALECRLADMVLRSDSHIVRRPFPAGDAGETAG